MDRLPDWTYGTNATTSQPGQNCGNSTSLSVDEILVTAPSWAAVNNNLKWIFPLHSYGFACLFFVLSFYTLFSILNLRSLISSRPFMTTINVFLCLLGASRSGCLFIDPYNLQETMPKVIGSIMWDIGFPCVTSAFCLVQLAFLQLTQIKFGPSKLQKESWLSFVITSHFSFVIASDVALAFHNHYITKYVVQTLFLIWSIILYLTFLHAGYKAMDIVRTLPSNALIRDNSLGNQKGIMQLAILAPYNNLATSVAAALVPTLFSQRTKSEDTEIININCSDTNNKMDNEKRDQFNSSTAISNTKNNKDYNNYQQSQQPTSTVPEVYVRPPTPTPTGVLPIITVSCPSRRSSLASSRRGSDVSASARESRRNSTTSVKFINEQDETSINEKKSSPVSDRPTTPITPEGILRRNSDITTPTGSSKDLRRCSDFTHEKNRTSQFATKLRRNSDFGNRTPKRMLPTDDPTTRLPQVLDISPSSSRRNSDLGGLAAVKVPESRRNSDVSYRRTSDFAQMRPLFTNRRTSDVSIKTLDKSPTHFQSTVVPKMEILENKSESDSDQHDCCNEKAALMNNDKPKLKEEDNKGRKKSLSWKNIDKFKDDQDITAESSLLPDNSASDRNGGGSDFTLHAILNHIANVNRAKTDIPLQIESSCGAGRKSQIRRVLHVIYATAILGIVLCIVDIARIFGPYGLLGETLNYGERLEAVKYPKPLPWLIYQTICRGLELIMGCCMASITKQSSMSPRHQYFNNYNSSYRFKQRDNPYI
ncbi:uncharacterized protein LOC130678625 [Microplitis mediator]|uniref:uncharacterized protein LOC130678625 n=1 Tax=Microplitis mediator TaxID=375433 RepID=UPI0025538679|nr:uncharacterized protein LOC130678625 [Microplitis mediator]